MKKETKGAPSHVEPILAVRNIIETVTYWHEILGFPDKWTWGEPPNHGGVAWHGTFIQFSLNPELAAASKGNSIFISVKRLEELYDFHQKNNAVIVEPVENKPWGVAAYTVEDINGYYVIFAGALLPGTKESSAALSSSVKITPRPPTTKEYQYLASSVSWSLYESDPVVEKLLKAPVFAVVAEDTSANQVIGCALLLGDHASFYYIKDVIVHPGWQSKHVGTALMKELTEWLDNNAANKALVALITPESLAPFYKQFGFLPAFSMVRYIESNEK